MLNWRKVGSRQVCYCPFSIGDYSSNSIMEKVGSVKLKNDGRWEYTLCRSKYNTNIKAERTSQGVCLTEQEAKRKVEANFG